MTLLTFLALFTFFVLLVSLISLKFQFSDFFFNHLIGQFNPIISNEANHEVQ